MTRGNRALCAFNHTLVALLSLAGLAIALGLALAPDRSLASAAAEVSQLQHGPASVWTIAVILGVVSIVVFLIEIWPHGQQQVFEAKVDGGTVEYPALMVAQAVEKELAGIDGITRSRVEVRGQRHRADLRVQLTVQPLDDSQTLAARAADLIREKVSGLGLELGRLRLMIEPSTEKRPADESRVPQIA